MSLPADTTGRSRTEQYYEMVWLSSKERLSELSKFCARMAYLDEEADFFLRSDQWPFTGSPEFRTARHAYRKRVNHSWDKEST